MPTKADYDQLQADLEEIARGGGEKQDTSQTEPPAPPIDAADIYFPGSMADRFDIQMGVLTNAVAECMLLARGGLPALTEKGWHGSHEQGNAWPDKITGGLNGFMAAHSANMRDAARLSEASARLIDSYARYRKSFGREWTVTVDDWSENRRRRMRTVNRFTAPPLEDATVIDGKATAESPSA